MALSSKSNPASHWRGRQVARMHPLRGAVEISIRNSLTLHTDLLSVGKDTKKRWCHTYQNSQERLVWTRVAAKKEGVNPPPFQS